MSIYPRKTLSYIAIASQENSQVWIGILEEIDESPYFRITSSDKSGVYNLPRTIVNDSMCGKEYCNIEGVAWIDENHLVLVSDVAKPSYGIICSYKDESIHYFSLPTITESSAMYSNHYSHLLHIILTVFHSMIDLFFCEKYN